MPARDPHAPPGPRPRFPGDLLLRLTRHRLDLLRSMAALHGDVSQLALGQQRVVLLTHPDDIRDLLITNQRNFRKGQALDRAKVLVGEGLLTSEGDLHLRQRRLVQPAFHRSRIALYAEAMTAAALAQQARWTDGQQLDANRAMMHVTLDIVATTLFGADVAGETAAITKALDDVFEAFTIGYSPLTPLLDILPSPRRRRFEQGKRRLDDTIARMIAARRAAGGAGDDLLSMLLHATDVEGDGTAMSDTQLRDEAITIFIAGHETTANALTWTWLMLARHPDAERSLHAELEAVLAGRVPTMDDLARLPVARAIIAESMRLYPPAYIIGRRAIGACTLGGYDFPARTIFLAPQFLVHRDPRWWPEPDRFMPERWLDGDAQSARPKLAYFPFGAGTRICVGEQFAWMEAILVLVTLAQRWRVRVDGPDPALDPIITLRPRGGLPARLERR